MAEESKKLKKELALINKLEQEQNELDLSMLCSQGSNHLQTHL